MRDITRMLAGLGGFLGCSGDGGPGVKTDWQGYTKLLHYMEAAEALNGFK
ncbi:IS4 family transposase [Microbulbifer epialgicus]|uniref:IS4 family transposase n=1 Tax=Microbulbifer epialgicus TaxID=393907 RepID=A0ABV4P5M0_9GAMM